MSYVLYRDGPPPKHSKEFMSMIISIFWIFGIILLAFISDKPCVVVKIFPNKTLFVNLRYPFKKIYREIEFEEIELAEVVETRDSDGDAYFSTRVLLYDKMTFNIAEGHDRARCEETCKRFKEACLLIEDDPDENLLIR